MSDIFIAYARNDKPRIRELARRLEEQGWSVWWDPEIPPGKTFDGVIEDALDESRCVIAAWSQASVSSDWVKTEAAEGKRRHILVPVLLEHVKIPLEFRRIQAADLSIWSGDVETPEYRRLLRAVGAILGEQAAGPPDVAQGADHGPGSVAQEGASGEPSQAGAAGLSDVPADKDSVWRTRLPKGILWSLVAVAVCIATITGVYIARTLSISEERRDLPAHAEGDAVKGLLRTYKVDIYYDEGSTADSATARRVAALLRDRELVREVVLVPKPLAFAATIGTPHGHEVRYFGSRELIPAHALEQVLNLSVPSVVFQTRATTTETEGTLSVVLFSDAIGS